MKEQEILKDIKIFNTICLVVMSLGALSLMLDMVHKRICTAVFNVAPEKPCEKPNELEMMWSTNIKIVARVWIASQRFVTINCESQVLDFISTRSGHQPLSEPNNIVWNFIAEKER